VCPFALNRSECWREAGVALCHTPIVFLIKSPIAIQIDPRGTRKEGSFAIHEIQITKMDVTD
jgi:hypothetical protein